MNTDPYERVRVRLEGGKRDAVAIECGPVTAWIPLSLIHGGDELRLRKAMRGDEMVLRIAAWKVAALRLPICRV